MEKIFVLICVLFLSINYSHAQDAIDNVRNKEITKQEVYEHIKYLASDELEGRFPGTAGDILARDYITKEFKKYNLTPKGNNGYVQEFDMITDVKPGSVNEFSIKSGNTLNEYKLGEDFLPFRFTNNDKGSGEIVFAGYGISAPEKNYDDYTDKNGKAIDVTGKIVIIMGYDPGANDSGMDEFSKYADARAKTSLARDKKAAGIIYIIGSENADNDELIKLRFDNVIQNSGIPILSSKRDIIEKLFKERGLDLNAIQKEINATKKPNSFLLKDASANMQVSVDFVKVKTGNVLGYIEGNDPLLKNEVIVIGAHFDHLGWGTANSLYEGKDRKIHYGADDNASGTAGVLEIAQKLSSEKNKLKRSVLFMSFTGEEEGLIGSSYFVNSSLAKDFNIVSMINMDMVGRMKDNKLIINGTGTSSVWNGILDSLNKIYNFKTTYSPDGFGPSDHSSFYGKNIPVLMFFTDLHSDYHKPSDTYDKINADDEARVLKMVYDVTMSVNNLKFKPEYQKSTKSNDENKDAGPVRVYVGTIPDFASSEEGFKISGVKADSPAEKGGIMAGDLMVKFGDKEIRNIYDYTAALGNHKPGEEVEVVVVRNGERITLKVICGKK